jgi:hypothetical protein
MKKSTVSFLLLSLLIAVFGTPVFAWNDVGHKLTAYIAWQRMSPAARESVIKILLKAPEDSGLSALYPQDSRSAPARRRELFMIAAYWADIVRDRDFPMRYKYHHGNWHYADTFWRQENGQVKILENPSEEGGKAVEQLFEAEKTMRNPSATDAEKAIAIAWFMHLSGDIHQPLHTSARVTDLEPKGDQGGNTFLLTPKNTPRENQMNLHWFWDSIVNRVAERKNDAADSAYLPPIGDKIMKKYPFAAMQSRLNAGKFDDWQKQSFAVATREVFPSTLVREQMPSNQYVNNAFRISEEQIALAGYRMGEMLNAIFGSAQTTAAFADPENNIPCRIIRKVRYPVTKTSPSESKLEIALLNLCPANKGMAARPMTSFLINGQSKMFEYDVEKVFKTEKEARAYAEKNGIKDGSF